MATRYQVRGPHPGNDYAKWTVVDTFDRDMTIDTARRKSDAIEVAAELNKADEPNDRVR